MNIRKKILFNPSQLKSAKPDTSDNTTANTKNSAILQVSKTLRFSNQNQITNRKQRNYLRTLSKQQYHRGAIISTNPNSSTHKPSFRRRNLIPSSISALSNQNLLPDYKHPYCYLNNNKFSLQPSQYELPSLVALKRTQLLTGQKERNTKLYNYPSSLHIVSNKQIVGDIKENPLNKVNNHQIEKKQQIENNRNHTVNSNKKTQINHKQNKQINNNHVAKTMANSIAKRDKYENNQSQANQEQQLQIRKKKLNSLNMASFYTTHKSKFCSKEYELQRGPTQCDSRQGINLPIKAQIKKATLQLPKHQKDSNKELYNQSPIKDQTLQNSHHQGKQQSPSQHSSSQCQQQSVQQQIVEQLNNQSELKQKRQLQQSSDNLFTQQLRNKPKLRQNNNNRNDSWGKNVNHLRNHQDNDNDQWNNTLKSSYTQSSESDKEGQSKKYIQKDPNNRSQNEETEGSLYESEIVESGKISKRRGKLQGLDESDLIKEGCHQQETQEKPGKHSYHEQTQEELCLSYHIQTPVRKEKMEFVD